MSDVVSPLPSSQNVGVTLVKVAAEWIWSDLNMLLPDCITKILPLLHHTDTYGISSIFAVHYSCRWFALQMFECYSDKTMLNNQTASVTECSYILCVEC